HITGRQSLRERQQSHRPFLCPWPRGRQGAAAPALHGGSIASGIAGGGRTTAERAGLAAGQRLPGLISRRSSAAPPRGNPPANRGPTPVQDPPAHSRRRECPPENPSKFPPLNSPPSKKRRAAG